MFEYRRRVRFAEVDAAGLVFFPRHHEYCHDVLEALFGALEGGYAQVMRARDLGVPTVHLETDFTAPLRFGDTALFETVVERIGRTSITFRHVIRREADRVVAAVVRHVVVTATISTLRPVPVPDDIRALLAPYQVHGPLDTPAGRRPGPAGASAGERGPA